MRPSLLKEVLLVAIEERAYIHIEGEPGVGKTQIPEQVARQLGYVPWKPRLICERVETPDGFTTRMIEQPDHDRPLSQFGFVHKHVPTCQPEDLALPQPANDGRLRFGIADWLPLEGDPTVPERGLILFDELAQGSDEVQKTLANIIQARECYGFRIKEGWSVISTGNREQDRAGARRVLSHLRDRSTIVELTQNLDDWCAWVIDNNAAPMELVAFMRYRPALLCDFDPNRKVNATARGWVEKVGRMLGKYPALAEFEMFRGAVGEGPASEFIAFMQMFRKLPNVDLIVMDPMNAPVPEEPSILFATATAVATRASENNFDRIMAYARRLSMEYAVLVVRDSCRHAAKRGENLTETHAFIDWASKEGAAALGASEVV